MFLFDGEEDSETNWNDWKTNYIVDIKFLIDATGSMGPIIEKIRKASLDIPKILTEAMEAANRQIKTLRVQLVGFRDYKVDGDKWIEIFDPTTDMIEFEKQLNKLKPSGGGDNPESSLDILLYVLRNGDFLKADPQNNEKGRKIVILLTDDQPLPIRCKELLRKDGKEIPQERAIKLIRQEFYTIKEFCEFRIIISAPEPPKDETNYYREITRQTNFGVYIPVKRAEGLNDLDINETLIPKIVNSINIGDC